MVDISSNSPVASPRNRPFKRTRSRIPTAPPVEGETNVKGTPERVPAPPINGTPWWMQELQTTIKETPGERAARLAEGRRARTDEEAANLRKVADQLGNGVLDYKKVLNNISWKENPFLRSVLEGADATGMGQGATENLMRLGALTKELEATILSGVERTGQSTQETINIVKDTLNSFIGNNPTVKNLLPDGVKTFLNTKDDPETAGKQLARDVSALFELVDPIAAAFPPTAAGSMGKGLGKGLGKVADIAAGDTTLLTRVRLAKEAQIATAKRAAEAAKEIASNNPKLRGRVLNEMADMASRIGNRGQVPTLDLVTGSETNPRLNPKALRDDTKQLLKINVDTPLPDEVEALYKPETLNKLVAVVSDLEQAGVKIINPKKPVIDSLGDLLFLEPDVVPLRAIQDAFSKYQLSWQDVLAGTIASGSEAGRILNRLSQLRKGTRRSVAVEPDDLADTKSFFTSTLRRLENVRRGALVSAVATASRNFQSGVYRLPTDSLANIIDTALINLKTDGVGSAFKGLVTPDTYKKNFASFNWVFNNPKVASDYIDLILNRPQFAKEFSHLTDNLNEIRNNVRVEPTSALGKGVDKVLTEAELFVDALNVPNKFQEQIIRRGFTLAEMERLVKANYKQDLLKLLDEGRLSDLLNNSSDLVPEKAPRFEEIISDSVLKGMQASYSSRPENNALATAADWWARTGGTLAYEFPRFLALTVEFLAENSAGIGLVARRKLFTPGASIKDLTAQDRRNISRNLVTLGGVYALYKYYDETDSDVDYTSIELPGSDKSVDVTAVWPLRPLSWTASAIKHIKNDTYDTWIGSDPDEILKTFALPSLRASGGGEVLFALRDAIFKDNDGLENSKVKDAVSKFAASYFGSFGALSRQSEQLEQLFGFGGRGDEQRYKSFPPDPTKSLGQSVEERTMARIYMSAGREAEFPQKVSPFYGNLEKSPAGSRLVGVTLVDSKEKNEVANFLTKFGISEYRAGSQNKYPKFRIKENTFLYKAYPSIVSSLKKVEEGFRKEYPDEGDLRQVVAPIVFANVNVLKAMAEAAAKAEKNEAALVEYEKLQGRLTGVPDKTETLSTRVTNAIEDIKEEIKNVDPEGRYQIQLESYTRLPLAERRQARVVFNNLREKEPDLSSVEDITALMVINKAMKTFEP